MKAPPKRTKDSSLAFRFTDETPMRISVLTIALNLNKTEVVEQAVKEAYERAEKDYPKEIRAAIAKHKKDMLEKPTKKKK